MENDVVLNKLNSLKRCLQRVETKVPQQLEEFRTDLDAQDIVSLNLQRAVQLCVDIAAHIAAANDLEPAFSMVEGFERLEQAGILTPRTCQNMKKAVGFRNVAVHDYCSINWDIVYAVSVDHLVDFKNFAREIMDWLQRC